MPRVGKKGSSAQAPRKPKLQFLTIPLEIREHIYNDLLRVRPASLFDLLLTNRQLAREGKPFLYRQPLTFDGQSELVDWLRNADRACLRHVVEIHFKLHDIDPAKDSDKHHLQVRLRIAVIIHMKKPVIWKFLVLAIVSNTFQISKTSQSCPIVRPMQDHRIAC